MTSAVELPSVDDKTSLMTDDLRDYEAAPAISSDRVRSLATEAVTALDSTVLEPGSVEMPTLLAELVATS